jgi:hypothetical protein
MRKNRTPKPLVAARWENVPPEDRSEAGRVTVKRRWEKTTPEERSKEMKKIAAQGAGRPRSRSTRCPCGAMTLKLARIRANVDGTSPGHLKGCKFYRPERVKPR